MYNEYNTWAKITVIGKTMRKFSLTWHPQGLSVQFTQYTLLPKNQKDNCFQTSNSEMESIPELLAFPLGKCRRLDSENNWKNGQFCNIPINLRPGSLETEIEAFDLEWKHIGFCT